MEMCKTLLGFAHFHRHRRHEPKQQNRTLHLLPKPDIFICYRQLPPLAGCSGGHSFVDRRFYNRPGLELEPQRELELALRR